jgi:hypothetical protein
MPTTTANQARVESCPRPSACGWKIRTIRFRRRRFVRRAPWNRERHRPVGHRHLPRPRRARLQAPRRLRRVSRSWDPDRCRLGRPCLEDLAHCPRSRFDRRYRRGSVRVISRRTPTSAGHQASWVQAGVRSVEVRRSRASVRAHRPTSSAPVREPGTVRAVLAHAAEAAPADADPRHRVCRAVRPRRRRSRAASHWPRA